MSLVFRSSLQSLSRVVSIALALAIAVTMFPPAAAPAAAALPASFEEVTAFSDLEAPTVVRFSPDGRVFVAEKSGLIKVFDGAGDTTATIFADLRTEVHNYWDRGLLGLALHPNFPTNPSVYALYTHDAAIGGTAPRWGRAGETYDDCPSPPGANEDGCVVSGRLLKLTASGNTSTARQVLIEDWCAQYPSHTIGSLEFGNDGMLYASGGDGANFNYADWGQSGNPKNPCGDPQGGVGASLTPPTAEGGALRSQDLRTAGDPVGLDGTIIRIDPNTGAGAPGNPFAASADANTKRIVSYGERNPFRITARPGTNEIWTTNVGWGSVEEINRLVNPTAATPTNFGWPCYEGPNRQGSYDDANLNVCENLYQEGAGAVAAPYFSYRHGTSVVPNDNCNGSSSITGLAFAPAANKYPAGFGPGSLYFADYSRGCIWVMPPGANGLPDPTKVKPFNAPASGPVFLTFGPEGDLYYIDINNGRIQHVRYTGGGTTNPPPTDPTPTDPTPTTCATGQYQAQYFNGIALGGAPVLTRCETAINNDWGVGGPGNGVPNENFSTRWAGKHDFATAGNYEFTATADDGVRVYVDNAIVIDKFVDQPATTYKATVALTAGIHDVKVEYYEGGGDAVAKVGWALTGGTTQPTDPPPTDPTPTTCANGQFQAQYFNGITLAGSPILTRCELGINNTWAGATGPGNGVPNDWFSTRWTGKQNFASAGNYEFTTTADDGVRIYVDNKLIIDKFINQPATTYKATVALTAGLHDITMEYYESGADAVAKLSWVGLEGTTPTPVENKPPAVSVAAPTPTQTFTVGETITFSGSATDPEDGVLPASALTWTLILQHCPSTCHAHTIQAFEGVASGSFVAPDHEYPAYIELRLTATDKAGLKTTVSRELQPKTVQLTFDSTPTGAQIAVGNTPATAPFSRTVMQGSNNGLSAPATFTSGGITYNFASWSDGGAQSHTIVAPATARTYTANYSRSSTTPTDPNPVACADGQFQAQYFNGLALGGAPILTRCEASINNDWGATGPGNGVPNDGFSTRWVGTQNFATAGNYEFTATADDGVRVYLDNVLIIDKFINQAATTYKATVAVAAGLHNVKVEYYENGGNAVAKASWAAVGGTTQPPPTDPPPTDPNPTTCANGQFQAQYFNGIELAGAPILTRCELGINNTWAGATGPGNGVPNDWFSTRWTGKHNFASAGNYEFTTTADDGVRIYVDNVLVVNKFVNQPATTYKATVSLTAGLHDVKMEYYESGADAVAKLSWGLVSGPTQPPPEDPTTPPTCAAGQFEATYFNNITLGGSPVLTRCETAINNDWGGASPGSGVTNDNFSARWVTSSTFAAGTYRFTTTADDGVRVYVDNVLVIDKFIDQAPTTYTVDRTLAAGTHSVKVEYYERGGGAVAKAAWTKI